MNNASKKTIQALALGTAFAVAGGFIGHQFENKFTSDPSDTYAQQGVGVGFPTGAILVPALFGAIRRKNNGSATKA